MSEKIKIEKKVLSENDRLAGEIRAKLTAGGILALNLVSSPGSGKTSLLERILKDMGDKLRMALVAGDVQTENDAERLARAGGRVVRPIVTGGACHLDARMVGRVLEKLDLSDTEVLVIENVGNLVCPSSYDLGEDMKVVLISTTEGDDKPLKYPSMFRRSSVMIINKIDLLGHSDFDINRVRENARTINADLEIFELSCRTGEGLDAWYAWLIDTAAKKRKDRNR
ncbi:MAG: hydrogenase accessory protein HypB [Candidatus Zixiibacteriota bacterium]|nr:MAG: hydrogenase accessory protein HypB [candidate division Zixibacteria bacterium]HDL04018.1 hydrogenase accessory protein HypB [candidate division Zixibacteria bacterium]